MKMIKTPVNGMRDIAVEEMEIRQFILGKIREVYKRFGFTEIETPNIEHIENLLSDLGWENEKLIFKIMKRGDKLTKSAESGNVNDLVDSGLRYDLTVPLSRFYANNKDKLTCPFKALQIGNVYRADRPQKGRFRQFMQCDLDILGEPTNLAEIEVLLATTTLLKEIQFDKYKFSIDMNDRKFLRAMYDFAGFNGDSDSDFDKVCITLDKLDKIGFDGVKAEFMENGYSTTVIDKFLSLFDFDENLDVISKIQKLAEKLGDKLPSGVADNLIEIVNVVSKNIDVKIEFNPTLVRGMGYYTGPIFEVKSEMFSGSVGGGGRYDKMIGKFIGVDTEAMGLSLGFERLISIYMDDNFNIPNKMKKTAFLVEKGIDTDKKNEIIREAIEERAKGNIIYIAEMAKNKKFQKENLSLVGYTEFKDFYNN